MRTLQLRNAKATLSDLVTAAEQGEPTTITRHGKPAAVIVSVADAERLYPLPACSFAEHLMNFPGGIEFERDQTPLREIDL